MPLLIEDWLSPELIASENISPQILELYVGTARTELEASPGGDRRGRAQRPVVHHHTGSYLRGIVNVGAAPRSEKVALET